MVYCAKQVDDWQCRADDGMEVEVMVTVTVTVTANAEHGGVSRWRGVIEGRQPRKTYAG